MKDLIINQELQNKKAVNTRPEEIRMALSALNNSADEDTDYDIIDDYLVEYDLTEKKDPIYWNVAGVIYERENYVKLIQIDC